MRNGEQRSCTDTIEISPTIFFEVQLSNYSTKRKITKFKIKTIKHGLSFHISSSINLHIVSANNVQTQRVLNDAFILRKYSLMTLLQYKIAGLIIPSKSPLKIKRVIQIVRKREMVVALPQCFCHRS